MLYYLYSKGYVSIYTYLPMMLHNNDAKEQTGLVNI